MCWNCHFNFKYMKRVNRVECFNCKEINNLQINNCEEYAFVKCENTNCNQDLHVP